MPRPTRPHDTGAIAAAALVGALVVGGCTSDSASAPGTAATPVTGAAAVSALGTPQWRPSAHFSPAENWMNDPNGLVFDDGTYHLFYQYNPNGNFWGDMSWGHATSTDLVDWTEMPVAMEATGDTEYFSGSVVIDHDNTSGLGSPGEPAWVALHTQVYGEGSGHPAGTQAQALAYSLDRGTTWQQYADGEPVLTLDPESQSFRDPKVLWYAPGGHWVMVTVVADDRVVKLYRSEDLLTWEWMSDVRGVGAGAEDPDVLWEMPDLFPLDVGGSEEKWVLLLSINPGSVAGGSGMQYFVGDFDGTTFTPQDVAPQGSDPTDFDWVDRGADFYAATTVSGAPDGRRVAIGWMGNWDYAADVPTTPWRGAMAIPRDLALVRDGDSLVLTSTISPEALDELRSGTQADLGDTAVDDTTTPLEEEHCADRQLLTTTLTPGSSRRAGLVVRTAPGGAGGTLISYDTGDQTLTVDRSGAGVANFSSAFSPRHVVPLPLRDGSLDLVVLVDRSSVEVFADGGRRTVTDIVLPPIGSTCLALFAEGGEALFGDVTVTSP